jgi:hypothetical protein
LTVGLLCTVSWNIFIIQINGSFWNFETRCCVISNYYICRSEYNTENSALINTLRWINIYTKYFWMKWR